MMGDGMGSKIRHYIAALRDMLESGQEIGDVEAFKTELLREIRFWQHERLVHFLVTMLFAAADIAVLLVLVFKATLGLFLLFLMLLVLLIPYIYHYYILENSVQTLYVIYEEVCRRYDKRDLPKCFVPEDYGVKIPPIGKKDPETK